MMSVMKALVLAILVACGGGEGGMTAIDDVGRMCDVGTVQTNETVVVTPASACKSKVCMHPAGAAESECTADCDTAEDCVKSNDTHCLAGFVCAPVLDVGPFSCRSFCVCADHVPITSCP